MRELNTLEIDWSTVEERRRLARLRREREEARHALLHDTMQSARNAMQLRAWIAAVTQHRGASAELGRMLEWAHAQLTELEAVSDPARLGAYLRDRDIFPEIDELHDPLGEPPARQVGGR